LVNLQDSNKLIWLDSHWGTKDMYFLDAQGLFGYSIFPSTSARSAMRITTPLKASCQ
jgi:hypothetical protein